MGIFDKLSTFIINRALKRPPDFVIGEPGMPYLLRWWLIPRNRFFNLYLHKFMQDDEDRALHDHPWMNCSIVLRGFYFEHTAATIDGSDAPAIHKREAGSVTVRWASSAHRISLGKLGVMSLPAWSLFITGPIIREWGFLCPKGWRHWKDFTSYRELGEDGRGRIGRGCE